jgi:transcription elongation factor
VCDDYNDARCSVAINRSKISKGDLSSFAPGDHVEVCEGELINLQGTIIGIDGDSIRILPKHEALKDEIPFKAHELRKFFSVGNHVKVLNGRFEGETGMIVGIDENKAIVLSDGTKDEVRQTSIIRTQIPEMNLRRCP